MRVLSWNILHGGGGRREAILAAIAAIDPDVVTLQEVRRSEGSDPLLEGLADLGLGEQVLSPLGDARSNGVLIASRWPLTAEPLRPAGPGADPGAPVYLMKARLSWPGRATGPAQGEVDGGGQDEEEGGAELLNLVAVRFPQKQAQIAPFEALLALPPAWRAELSLLIGDFNCGIPLSDSQTRTFLCTAWFQRQPGQRLPLRLRPGLTAPRCADPLGAVRPGAARGRSFRPCRPGGGAGLTAMRSRSMRCCSAVGCSASRLHGALVRRLAAPVPVLGLPGY